MTTVAAIDCGTNSIRLLVLRGRSDGGTTELCREVRLARLGQGVDATGEFHADALARAFVVCDEFAGIVADLGVDRLRFVATSAARDVTNRDVFFDGVRGRLGVDVDVITGDEEARLSAEGVRSGIEAPQPALVLDIGGGSTELVVVEGDDVVLSISLNVGAVRVRERFLHTDPPTTGEQQAAREFIGGLLDGSGVDFGAIATAVGVAGTVTSVAAATLGLDKYSRDAVHGARLSRDDIAAACAHWTTTKVADIESEPCMHPLRAGVIGGGSLILDEISARVPGGCVLVSETDILDGIAHELLG
ncbi:Ppx/GppA phosphatase family protein [Tessaracoccus antarcticus]|uniref:Ppx/GppA family phosphatase n=1 Tax=Tessaracoccus antarcticus TaxID=2479848 RepID=A0A3M0GBC1_9ACTN|nr:Ppx/GppA phosphatase family protein [Tessaracoccus antarcticus]RMB62190.1 Ppx/GppA family phosphatase [Tessaracoccus antarcticus]